MKHFLDKLYFLLSLFLFVSCSASVIDAQRTLIPEATIQFLWKNPIPLPYYIGNLTTYAGTSGFEQDICAEINEAYVWEAGQYGSDVFNRIRETVSVTVDSKKINDIAFNDDLNLLDRYDSSGKRIGSHGGGVAICFNTDNFSTGLHLALIRFQSKSGVEYSHTWTFEIP